MVHGYGKFDPHEGFRGTEAFSARIANILEGRDSADCSPSELVIGQMAGNTYSTTPVLFNWLA